MVQSDVSRVKNISKQDVDLKCSQYIRVLMIGPGEGVGGGISSLVETFLPLLKTRVSLYYLPSVKQRPLKDSGKLSIPNILIAFSQYIRFFLALIRYRPNIIHLHTSQGIAWLKDTFFVIAGKIFRRHVVLHIHGGNFVELNNQDHRFVQAYTRYVLGLVDAVISVSTEWKNRFSKFVPDDRVFPLKNCIDVQAIQPNVSITPTAIANLLFVGRIGQKKGAFDLVDAMHLIQADGMDVHAWMAGPEERDGDFEIIRERLDRYQLSSTCDLLGSVDREEVLGLLKKAAFFVLPSYYEGLPMAVLEALAAGLPIIATPVGGIPEVVQDGFNGYLVPIGDVQTLANRITHLAKNPELRAVMGRRSRGLAERDFDSAHYVDKLVSLYTSIMGVEKGAVAGDPS